ncbi:hypothetical protein [Ruminococcus albus]|uniref:hypothetical protein n=1 Tax=Ruminococcus albus TaxID=1264 RepID=UPI0004919A03|nr:hypothetical protein [Ruminococcus albus]
MSKIVKQLPCDKYSVLILDSTPPTSWNSNIVIIDGITYEAEIVYDLQNALAVKAKETFIGKTIEYKTA